jgi:hypothetical protein
VARVGDEVVQIGNDLARARHEPLSGFGELHAPWQAVEESGPEHGLDFADTAGQGRLSQAKGLCRGGKGLGPSHFHHVTEPPQIYLRRHLSVDGLNGYLVIEKYYTFLR